jgi:hypothetical protein
VGTFSDLVLVSGTEAVEAELIAQIGTFQDSLTISGAPVSTGTGGGSADTLQDAYDNGDGTISTIGGKPFELTGNGELTAVTGTFTTSLTVSGLPVRTDSVGVGAGVDDVNSVTGSVVIDGSGGIVVNTDSQTITIDGSGVVGGGGGVAALTSGTLEFRGAMVTTSTGIDTEDGQIVYIPWDTEIYDTGGFHSTSVVPNRFTIPVGVNKIQTIASVRWSDVNASDGDERHLSTLHRDSSGAILNYYSLTVVPRSTNVNPERSALTSQSPVVNVNAGETFEVYIRQQTGGALSLVTTPTYANFFSIEVKDPVTVTGIPTTTDPLVLASGSFTQSLTVSGIPVSTGTRDTLTQNLTAMGSSINFYNLPTVSSSLNSGDLWLDLSDNFALRVTP